MNNLKERRNALGITQIELAEKVGVSMMTIQLWERGALNPRKENEERLEFVMRELEGQKERGETPNE